MPLTRLLPLKWRFTVCQRWHGDFKRTLSPALTPRGASFTSAGNKSKKKEITQVSGARSQNHTHLDRSCRSDFQVMQVWLLTGGYKYLVYERKYLSRQSPGRNKPLSLQPGPTSPTCTHESPLGLSPASASARPWGGGRRCVTDGCRAQLKPQASLRHLKTRPLHCDVFRGTAKSTDVEKLRCSVESSSSCCVTSHFT